MESLIKHISAFKKESVNPSAESKGMSYSKVKEWICVRASMLSIIYSSSFFTFVRNAKRSEAFLLKIKLHYNIFKSKNILEVIGFVCVISIITFYKYTKIVRWGKTKLSI